MFGITQQTDLLKEDIIPIQMICSKANEKTLIINIPTEKADSHFGKVSINAKIEGEDRSKSEQKKERWELQTLKMEIESSAKKSKQFNISMPINRGVKKPSDKIHFLLEFSDKNALLTIVDNYTDCRMTVVGKTPQISFSEAVESQKRKLDRRRKNSHDENEHNDPDFQDDNEEREE